MAAVAELVSAAANSGMDEKKSLAQSGGGLNAKATAAVRQVSLSAGSHGSIQGGKEVRDERRREKMWGRADINECPEPHEVVREDAKASQI